MSTKSIVQSPRWEFPAPLTQAVDAALNDWQTNSKMARLWRGDTSLWSSDDENKWVGWLTVVEDQIARLQQFAAAATDAQGFKHVLLLGMGGSSLCPEVLKITFGKLPGRPELHVLDSTDPAQVKAVENQVDLARTLCIVASKSGSTLEPNIFKQYFFDRMEQTVGKGKAGERFIAITDPGSKMQQVAERDRFRKIFFGVPSIGGRYSALSDFGIVPAAVIGLDLRKFLDRTEEMVHACRPETAADQNPGAVLGTILGTLGNFGRNKLTIVTSPGISDLGAWLEQLVAESTGKQGKGIIPVDREALGPPEVYGNDRVFAHLRLAAEPDTDQKKKLDALKNAGHPVVEIELADVYDLGQEFFRWEIATAVAGSILKINPFNQPTSKPARSPPANSRKPTSRPGSCRKKLRSSRTAAASSSLPTPAMRRTSPSLPAIARSPGCSARTSISSARETTSLCWPISK